MNDSTAMELSMVLDLKPFFASLEKIEGVSKESVAQLQQIFGKVPSVQVPFDAKKVKEGLDQLEKSSKPASAGMNRAAQSALSLSYIVRDSPYLFQNFNMGIMAISNNINPFIDQMLRAKQETGSWKGAIGTLSSGLTGIGGLSFAFSVIVSLLTAYSFASNKAESKTRSLKEEVKQLKNEYADLMEIQIKQKMNEWTKEYENQTKAIEERLSFWETLGSIIDLNAGLLGMLGFGDLTKEEIENLRKLRTEHEALNDAMKGKGVIPELKAKIKYLTDLRDLLPKSAPQASFDSYNNQISALQKRLAKLTDNGKEDKELYKSDKEIRKEIADLDYLINNRVKLGITDNELIRILDLKIEKQQEYNAVYQAFLDLLYDWKSRSKGVGEYDFIKYITNDLKNFKPMDKVEVPNKPEAFTETNAELERMLFLSESLTTSFNRAGEAVASAAASGIQLFKQENSLLQIFINSLVRAIAETLTLKLITTGLNIVGGLIGNIPLPGNITNSIGRGTSSILYKSNSGFDNYSSTATMNKLSASITNTGASNYSNPIVITKVIEKAVPIVLTSEIAGRDLRIVQKNEEQYRRQYTGWRNG